MGLPRKRPFEDVAPAMRCRDINEFVCYLIGEKLISESNDWCLGIDTLLKVAKGVYNIGTSPDSDFRSVGMKFAGQANGYSFRDCPAVTKALAEARPTTPPVSPPVPPLGISALVEHMVSYKILSAKGNWRLSKDQFATVSENRGHPEPWPTEVLTEAGIRWLDMVGCYCFVRCKAVTDTWGDAEQTMVCTGCSKELKCRHFVHHLIETHKTPGLQPIIDRGKEIIAMEEQIKTLKARKGELLVARDAEMTRLGPFFEMFGFSETV